MTYRDIHGNELKAGDTIRLRRTGNVCILENRTYPEGCGVKDAYYGGRTRLCLGDSCSEPTPSHVREEGIERIGLLRRLLMKFLNCLNNND